MEICAGEAGYMSRPQSILFISNHGDIVGGGEISMLQLMCALDRSQWKPLLVVPYEGAVAKEAHGSEISTLVVPLPAVSDTSMASLSSILALWRIIYQEDAQIVHANGTRAMMYGGLAAKFAQRPAIWHVRVADSDGWLDRALYQFSAKIIVNSEAVSRRFTWGTADHVRCIHNGVDMVRFAPRRPSSEHRAVLGLSPYDRVVVSVGRFVAYKGYADLLAAAAILHRQDTGVHWVLVGDGELRSDLVRQSERLGMSHHVHFTGWMEDIRETLALADVFVLPSHGEHFGRVLIEAMAMEKPVVATEAGGVPEIVKQGETGWLVEPGQPDRLAEAIGSLLADRAQAIQFGESGRRVAEDRFSLHRHAQQVQSLYHELMGVCCG
jgi:glycosyltransferase involved in cell wall biosynthesis